MNYQQDMPPKGGYDPIQWARKLSRQRMSGARFFAGMGVAMSLGWAQYYYFNEKYKQYALETNDGRLALEPLLRAERERNLLRQLRKNRDDENELMKDVPGWVTGTYYGEPVFHNQADRFPNITYFDVYMHNHQKHMNRRLFEKCYH